MQEGAGLMLLCLHDIKAWMALNVLNFNEDRSDSVWPN